MDKTLTHTSRYKVGAFVVDLNAAQVIAPDGCAHQLKEKALKTLMVFLQEPDKYFSNEQLIEEVYASVSIGTSTVAQNIKQLRVAFNDSDKSIFINRHKVGYRLTLPVSEYLHEPQQKKQTARKHSAGFSFRLLAMLCVIGSIYALGWYLAGRQPLVESPVEQLPLTYLKGQEYFPSLSMDKRWLLFSHRKNSTNWSLYARQMQTGQLMSLLESSKYSYKHGQVTRSGEQILLTRLSSGQCEFVKGQFDRKSVQLNNLVPIRNCHVSSEGARIIEGHSPDHYIFSNGETIDTPFSLYSFSAVTQQSERLTAPPVTGRGDYYMALSPDHTSLAFLRNTQQYVTEIRLFDLNKRNDVLLDHVDTTLFTVNWSHDGKSLIYKNAANQIVALDLQSYQKTVLKEARFPLYAPFALDSSSQRIGVIAGSLTDRDIVSHNLESQGRQVLLESSYSETLPIFSPKNNRLAWVSNRSGIFQLWLKESDQVERALTRIERSGRFTSLDFSPDGEKIGGTFEGQCLFTI